MNTSTSQSQQKPVISVQTLLAAKKEKNKPPPQKRTHSEVSYESNTSLDLSGLINFQKDLDQIKFSLKDVATNEDFNEVTKDLVKTSDLENLVTGIVKRLFSKSESTIEKKMNDKVNKIQTEMMEKAEALSIENDNLKKKVDIGEKQIASLTKELSETSKIAKQADISSNYNEQYSGKNKIKVYNFLTKQDLRKVSRVIELVKSNLNLHLEERDIVAIHRLPSQHEPSPLIVICFSSDVKRSLMRVRKELKNRVKFVDDVMKRNVELIHRLENSHRFDQVWYFNCGVYGRTSSGLQMKFEMYDDINYRIHQGK